MSYYKKLGLQSEPFSTSPDPYFFYQSQAHKAALYRLRVGIGLKRGLSVVLGDVGTGKTTLSRKLSQYLLLDDNVVMSVILNPTYTSEKQLLADLIDRFHIPVKVDEDATSLDYLRIIEQFLYEKGFEERKTIVLLIDESQNLTPACLEVLRSLLNYETNEYKILQLVLMGQNELYPLLTNIPNFWDRVAVKCALNPLQASEVKALINFRLTQAGYDSHKPLFSDEAFELIYKYSRGFPRKIALLCHNALEHLIMYNRAIVDRDVM